ncbi:MAG: hypothetical protein RI972_891 [Pseudomonadota bacterium]
MGREARALCSASPQKRPSGRFFFGCSSMGWSPGLPHNHRMKIPLVVLAACGAAALAPALAQQGAGAAAAAAPVVVRCPGPPVLYADNLSAQEARRRNCKPVGDLPVAQAPNPPAAKPAAAAAAAPAATVGLAGNAGSTVGAVGTTVAAAQGMAPATDTRVRADEQRQRDAEARRILEAELRREEARLQEALKAAGGTSARGGDRPAADSAQVRRAETDIEAIRRELARLR